MARRPFPKFPVYDSLRNLNLAFQVIAIELERLDDHQAIPLETIRLYNMRAGELRAGINHRLTDVLKSREERDWAHYGKQRIAEEQRLSGSV